MKRSIEKLRFEYGNTSLEENELLSNPIEQFGLWFQEAVQAKLFEPNGMTLSTVSHLGRPSSRTILLKAFDTKGFVFFTSYMSRKGEQLAENPYASITFWWREIFRQVSIEGKVQKISRADSIRYFSLRPRGAQIAACASSQSAPLASRIELEESFKRIQKKMKGKQISCPSSWGGYRLIPDRMEFWQGRENRLHDRFLYVLTDGEWLFSRLAP